MESGVVVLLVILVFVIWLLCVPGMIAKRREHPYTVFIYVLGILGGLFFGIGWIAALVWAFFSSPGSEVLRKVKANPDVADELSKLKRLESEGILTAEEFQMKKTQLLGA